MNFAVVALSSKYPISDTLIRVLKWISENGHTALIAESTAQFLEGVLFEGVEVCASDEATIPEADMVLSVGGDGTLLRTARLTLGKNKPILGINSGRLGFLANINQVNIEEALEIVVSKKYETDRRAILEARTSAGEMHYALNEFLFSKGASSSMISLSAQYDGMFINRYWCDGIIVATPTGSTAYNMSAGGPIVMPSTDVMVLNPINPHTLTTRPLILPSGKVLTVVPDPFNQEVLFSKDGEISDITGSDKTVHIQRSDFTIDLIKLPGQTYFDTLRNKLMWGMDIRDNNN